MDFLLIFETNSTFREGWLRKKVEASSAGNKAVSSRLSVKLHDAGPRSRLKAAGPALPVHGGENATDWRLYFVYTAAIITRLRQIREP
jgi:hypothetical protein